MLFRLNKKNSKPKKLSIFLSILGVILFLYAVFLIALILWGFFTSVKADKGVTNLFIVNPFGLPEGAPWDWEWENYSTVLKNIYVEAYIGQNASVKVKIGIMNMLSNTLLYAFGGAGIATIVPTIVAYATAKTPYKFNGVIDAVIITCMAIPIVGSGPSELQVLNTLNLYDTWVGFFAQRGHFITVYYLIMKAAFRAVPASFSEAAQIEGAGHYQVMFRIVLPLVKNIIFTIFLLIFVAYWNEYNYTLIYMPTHPTLAYGVFYLVFINGENFLRNAPMQMAASIVLFAPILILFICLKNVLMQNLSMGGIKE